MRPMNQRLHTIPLICVFDNDEVDRRIYIGMAERFLEEHGMEAEIRGIRTDDEFVRQMEEQIPDVIFLDLNRPGRQGTDICLSDRQDADINLSQGPVLGSLPGRRGIDTGSHSVVSSDTGSHDAGRHGIEVAREIRRKSRTTQIIFVSQCNEFAAEAFEVEALSYLKKPVDYARFKCALDRAMCRICRAQSLTVNDDREKKTIFVDDIIYMETQNRKLTFHLREDLVESYLSLTHALEMLPKNRFVQISRFTAVALRHIRQMHESEVVMKNHDVLPLSPKMAVRAHDLYSAYRLNNATI